MVAVNKLRNMKKRKITKEFAIKNLTRKCTRDYRLMAYLGVDSMNSIIRTSITALESHDYNFFETVKINLIDLAFPTYKTEYASTSIILNSYLDFISRPARGIHGDVLSTVSLEQMDKMKKYLADKDWAGVCLNVRCLIKDTNYEKTSLMNMANGLPIVVLNSKEPSVELYLHEAFHVQQQLLEYGLFLNRIMGDDISREFVMNALNGYLNGEGRDSSHYEIYSNMVMVVGRRTLLSIVNLELTEKQFAKIMKRYLRSYLDQNNFWLYKSDIRHTCKHYSDRVLGINKGEVK